MNKQFIIETIKRIKDCGSHTETQILAESLLLYLNTLDHKEAPVGHTVKLLERNCGLIECVKTVKELTGKGLKEAKDLSEQLPSIIAKDITYDEATKIRNRLVMANCRAEVIPDTNLGRALYD